MAFTVPPAVPRNRPTVVTIASGLLGFVAFGELLQAVLILLVMGDTRDAYQKAYEGYENANVATTLATAGTAMGVGLAVIIGIGVGVLAALDAAGKNPARIVTWVFGGISLCCLTLSLATTAVGGLTKSMGSTSGAPDPTRVTELVNDAMPSWYTPVTTSVAVLILISLLAAVILLALPAANQFFRKPPQQWEPPVPQPGAF